MIKINCIKLIAFFSLVFINSIVIAGTDNIANRAKATASTALSEKFIASHITDGIIGINGKGEWACEGATTDWGYVRFPWVQLDWKEPQAVNKIILYDRPSMNEHIASGKLLFSDSSIIWVNEIRNDGTAKVIRFDARHIKWVRFITTDGEGKDLVFLRLKCFQQQLTVRIMFPGLTHT
ncbi:MAG: discoidin domain-containing protein [Ferruginibacter sp.]